MVQEGPTMPVRSSRSPHLLRRAVWSIRATRATRVLLVEIARGSIGLLHFDNDHDAAYAWLDSHRREVDGYCGNPRTWKPAVIGTSPVPGVRTTANDALPVRDGADIEAMIAHGLEHYLSSLDESQAGFARVPIVGREGPVVVRGGAGTGKTAVAIARLKYLAERPEMGFRQALYLCFSNTLKKAVAELAAWHYGGQYPKNDVVVQTFHGFCTWYLSQRSLTDTVERPAPSWPGVEPEGQYPVRLVNEVLRGFDPTRRERVSAGLGDAVGDPAEFIAAEIMNVLWPSGAGNRDEYLELERKGMGTSLRRSGREAVWEVFEALRETRDGRKWAFPELVEAALATIQADKAFLPYRGVVVDEAQDCGRTMVRLAKALVGGDERRLFFVVDPNQGIFPNGFQWAVREIQPRGRQVSVLRRAYRNTEEIQEAAAPLLADDDPALAAQPSARHGPRPFLLFVHSSEQADDEVVARVKADLAPSTTAGGKPWQPAHVGILVPTRSHATRIRDALIEARVPVRIVGETRGETRLDLASTEVKILTLHAAKGLDFPLVYLAHIGEHEMGWLDPATQRSLLYVGLTRAGHRLTVVTPASDPLKLLGELDLANAFDVGGPAMDDGLLALRR